MFLYHHLVWPAIKLLLQFRSIIANSCTNITNNTTKYFYDDGAKAIAMGTDSSAAPSLGLTEVCVDKDPSAKYVTDSGCLSAT